MTLVEFLLARVAEDEAQIPASERGQPDWFATCWNADVDAVAAYPERWLAECEAKRRIVTEFADVVENGGDGDYRLGQVFALLALPYADHPGYNPGWRP